MVNKLFYTKPANAWEEALPLGNGRIGAMVFGSFGNERIALNEDTLWSGYPKHNNNPDAYKYLDEIRNAIFNGEYDKATKINNEKIKGFWSDSYLPFGDLKINYKNANDNGYTRTLDLANGVCVSQNNSVKQTVFVSHPAQLLVVNIKSDKGVSFEVSFDSQLKHTISTTGDSLVITGQATDVEIAANNLIKTKNKLNRILASNCGKDIETIAKDTDRDNWMSAQEALEYGLVDKVIEKR